MSRQNKGESMSANMGKAVRIWIDYREFDGTHSQRMVIAESFEIPGVVGHEFAVHNTFDYPDEFTATHVGTGFAVVRQCQTPDEAIEQACQKWLSCPPESLALKMIRAKNTTGVKR